MVSNLVTLVGTISPYTHNNNKNNKTKKKKQPHYIQGLFLPMLLMLLCLT